MKKYILILLLLLLITGLKVNSCDVKCVEPYDMSSSASRFLSTVTGQKSLSQFVGKRVIKKAVLNNITSGNVKTDLKSFSVRDLKAGRFKSIEVWGKDLNLQGVYIDKLHVKTLCDFNYITQQKNGDIFIKEDLPLAVELEFTEDNLNKTMESEEYKRIINDINSLAGSFNVFKIDSTYTRIRNNKFHYVMKYTVPFIKGYKNIVFVSDLSAKDGEIEFENTKIMGDSTSIDIKYFSKIINYLNPLDFSLQIQENKNAKVNIRNVKITDGKVAADGIIVVKKDKE